MIPTTSASTSPVPTDDNSAELCLTPTGIATSGSSSELSTDYSDNQGSAMSRSRALPGRPGETSPSSVCRQRRLSAAVVTTSDAKHEYVEGREKIILPMLTPLSSSKPKKPMLPKASLHRSLTIPIDRRMAGFTLDPHPLRLEAWAEPPASNYKLRGPRYLADGVKRQSDPAVFKLLTVDLVQAVTPDFGGICAQPNERFQKALRREVETGVKELPAFVFAVNLCIPGPKCFYHLVSYFGVDDIETIKNQDTPFGRVAAPFFFGSSDEYRDKTFKLIPNIVEGNYIVKTAVGSKPALLGKKLKQHYVRTDRYFEMVIDIESNPVAKRIVKLALGYAKTLVVDMMFLLEGTQENTLPERMLGGVRIKQVDFKKKDGKRACL
jgi:hypothetical protein